MSGISPSVVLDVLLVVLLVGYAGAGFRQGLVVGLGSLVGFVGGVLLGAWFLPGLLPGLPPGATRSLVLLGGAVLLGVVGQVLLASLAGLLRGAVTWRPARAVDAATGLVAAVVAASAVVWLVAGAVRVSPFPTLSGAVAGSRVVSALDTAVEALVPDRVGGAIEAYYDEVSGELFPRVFAGEVVEPLLPVDPPDAAVLQDPGVARAAAGVVRITGIADECRRGQEGSGFVWASERVVTNAHVVAGVDEPRVQVGGTGEALPASVVAFDPERDLAVLAVPGLQARPLPVGEPLGRGDDAVVAGFPLNGPYVIGAGRVRDVVTAVGEDIYGEPGVEREVYSLAAQVRPGNSGGPVLDPTGAVVGVVFARSLQDAGTGYAVTLAEAGPVLDGAGSSEQVDTGGCVAG
ncbi:MarP family serine protease [Aquipuribacter nitratireducens]|uniref:MarP family serine protease n=1 Tax=Aquipuribacter nitratireducens TaxID=650104 RepID=A0ABW0GPP4_9MICO